MTRRPNIVMILTDDHAAHAISAYGSVVTATPRIDEIARLGRRFDTCFATNSPAGLRTVPGYTTDVLTDLSLAWADSLDGDDPWCLLIHHHKAPHRPWVPRPRLLDKPHPSQPRPVGL